MISEVREAALERARHKYATWSAIVKAPDLSPDMVRTARRLVRQAALLVTLRKMLIAWPMTSPPVSEGACQPNGELTGAGA
jgi:hypothetical protein